MSTTTPKLAQTRARFEEVRKAQEAFIQSLPSLEVRSGKKYHALDAKQRETFCEMAFVVLFTAWEQFLESSFENYVVEAPLSSFRNRHRVLVMDLETAHDLIRGSRRYVEWAEPQVVRERAGVFFKRGEPFESALNAVTDDLVKMKIIRNRCVHFSQHAIGQYEEMLRKVYGSRRRMTPGRLLMDAPTSGLSTVQNAMTYQNAYTLYSEILATAVDQIVPKKN